MSDILSPFLVVFPNSDALAYMCFSALMNKIRQNFLDGQPGVHTSIQRIGSLLQRVDKKLWRQVGNDSFTPTGLCQHRPSGLVKLSSIRLAQQPVSMSILRDRSIHIAVLHGLACNKPAADGSSLSLGAVLSSYYAMLQHMHS